MDLFFLKDSGKFVLASWEKDFNEYFKQNRANIFKEITGELIKELSSNV